MATKAFSSGRTLEEFRSEEEFDFAIKAIKMDAWKVTSGQEPKSVSSAASSPSFFKEVHSI